ncbi:MAG: LysR family transcriptional regulator [Blastococcus sp.]|jgi:DNA-binding transcriptional LysR family regulator|nr:LysR family transcriptional regulator [Blastococcus sp.]
MDLDDLAAFLAVVEHRGFRRAAEATFISQPSLTRRITRLEQELKVTLLERGPRGIKLTSRGQALAGGAKRILAAVEETRATTSGSWTRDILIGCTPTSAGRYLSDFLVSWIPTHPHTRVQMVEDGPLHTRQRLIAHEVDAAIVAPPLEPEFDSLPITRAQLAALIPPGHRLGTETGPLSIEELHDEPVLLTGEQYLTSQLLTSSCRVAGVKPEVVFQCSVGNTLVSLTRAGLGISVLSSAVDHSSEGLLARPLCSADGRRLEFDLHIAWSRHRVSHPVLEEFAQGLSEFTRPLRQLAGAEPLEAERSPDARPTHS